MESGLSRNRVTATCSRINANKRKIIENWIFHYKNCSLLETINQNFLGTANGTQELFIKKRQLQQLARQSTSCRAQGKTGSVNWYINLYYNGKRQ